ncbi:MAG: TRAP transporter small permease subunit [Mesorhizobium sp.]
MKIISILNRIERFTTGAALTVAMCAMLVLCFSCLYQVLARFVLLQSLAWSETLSTMMLTWAVFFALPAAFREGAMISVDIIPSIVGKDKAWLVLLIGSLTLFLLVFSAWYGWQMLPRVRFQQLAGLHISIWWAYLAIPVGTTLAALAVIMEAIDTLRGRSEDNSMEMGL